MQREHAQIQLVGLPKTGCQCSVAPKNTSLVWEKRRGEEEGAESPKTSSFPFLKKSNVYIAKFKRQKEIVKSLEKTEEIFFRLFFNLVPYFVGKQTSPPLFLKRGCRR